MDASRVGVKLHHPTPAARNMLAADPPPPGEGEARGTLGSELINRIADYNFVRIHKTLRITPAMAAGVTKRLWEIGDVVKVLEAWQTAN